LCSGSERELATLGALYSHLSSSVNGRSLIFLTCNRGVPQEENLVDGGAASGDQEG
jgi:hypothetical protein